MSPKIKKIDSSEVLPPPPWDLNTGNNQKADKTDTETIVNNIPTHTNTNNLNKRNTTLLTKRERDQEKIVINNETGEPPLKKQKINNTNETKQSPPTPQNLYQSKPSVQNFTQQGFSNNR